MRCPTCGSAELRWGDWQDWLGTKFHAECPRCGLQYNIDSESFDEDTEEE